MLTEVSVWERAEAADAEPAQIGALELPRNAELTLRVLSAEGPGLGGVDGPDRPRVVLRVHTEDGGAVVWERDLNAPATAPLRVRALTGLDVVAGEASWAPGGRFSGPAALAEIPRAGRLDPASARRLADSVAESGGSLWLAAHLPIRPVADDAPGRSTRHLVLEGSSEHQGRRVAGAAVVVLEIGVEIVDRAYRPEEEHKRDRDEEDDPVHQPRPRELASRR